MRTLENLRFAEPTRLVALTALPVAFCLAISADAAAQQPPFGPQPPGPFGQQPAPGAFGQPAPAPGQPAPAPGGFQPAPGGFGQPAPGGFGQPAPGGFGQPAPGGFGQPAPGGFGQPAPMGQFGQQPTDPFGMQPPATTPNVKPAAPIDEAEERARTLINQPNTFGSTGLLRTSHAASGAAGTFRVSFLSDFFFTNNFLCDPDLSTAAGQPITCSRDNKGDSANHVGAFFSVSATPVSFLEAFATIRTYANYNDQGKPKLLQVLGDTTFGLKGFTPKVGNYFSFGAEAHLMLLNGAGAVGPLGASTSAFFRGLITADFRKPGGAGVPLRINVNASYKLDNSGQIVNEVETERAKEFRDGRDRQPITRIERYGLGINRVDTFQPAIGIEAPFRYLQPYAEYSVDVPVNRQGYECHTGRISRGDVCLGLADFGAADPQTAGGPGYAGIPSRVSLGVRVTPFSNAFRGLSGHAGVDIGLSGTSVFIEEVTPQAPWTVYLGLAYAYDGKVAKAAPPPPPPPPPPEKITVPAPQTFVRGTVHETNKPDAVVADAIVTLEGSADPPYATNAAGKFLTRHLEPGSYTFAIKAPGYKPGTCQATVMAAGSPMAPAFGRGTTLPGQTPFGAPGQPGAAPAPAPAAPPPAAPANPFGGNPFAGNPFAGTNPFGPPGAAPGAAPGTTPPGQTAPTGLPGTSPALPPAPQGTTYVDVDCSVEALPKVGSVQAKVKDAETGAAIPGAIVKATDSAGKERSATADGSGTVTFKDLPPGALKIRAESGGFMNTVGEADVRANDEAKVTLAMSKRPAPRNSLVKLTNNEIKILKQVHFEVDSAKILGDSNALLEEVADVLQRNPNIRRVEVQGHTDNTGTREHNQTLSEQRALAVRNWLIAAGVDASRLMSRGYGQDKPLAPNVTALQKAKNRRVQFIILEKTR
ncbi:MAG: OmpA family protein [Polyangiaceae bacterium]|nr:OmpA family protein [Polyangiaceae bacterium]